jgi:hypothetical protein
LGAGVPEKLNRNSLCWCGSGKKYKKCHHAEDAEARARAGDRQGEPRPREYWEVMRSILPPSQLRSDEVGPKK